MNKTLTLQKKEEKLQNRRKQYEKNLEATEKQEKLKKKNAAKSMNKILILREKR